MKKIGLSLLVLAILVHPVVRSDVNEVVIVGAIVDPTDNTRSPGPDRAHRTAGHDHG